MKGFTKDGKFRPTSRTKSALKKSDINDDPLERARKNMSRLPQADPVKLKKGMIRKDQELDDQESNMTFKEFVDSGSYLEDEVRERASEGSPHFFDADTMRFFSSRLSELMWQKGGSHDSSYKTKDIYFITSEADKGSVQHSGSTRAFTVRKIDADGDIDTVSEFQEHATLNDARHEIKDILEGID